MSLGSAKTEPIEALALRNDDSPKASRKWTPLVITILSTAAVAVHGYHPFAEDGGLYMAGIEHRLNPALFRFGPGFVMGHPRFAVFTPAVAELVRLSHVSLETVLFGLYAASLWLTLYAMWQLASRCYGSAGARWGAVGLLASCMTLPIAGTSLLLLDPYVTARSFSTPFSVLALVAAIDLLAITLGGAEDSGPGCRANSTPGATWRCILWLALAGLMHPLMTAYALGAILVLGCVSLRDATSRRTATLGVCVFAVALAAIVQWTSPVESAIYLKVAMSRSYWFLARWQWYEIAGLLAPVFILGWIARERIQSGPKRALAQMGVATGVSSILISILFGRAHLATHVVARLQPLRVFEIVYVLLILVIGAGLGERFLKRGKTVGIVALLPIAALMWFVERQTFPASDHLELPRTLWNRPPKNQWEQAFLWIKQNTPVDAVFAMDAHYIRIQGEDAQGFRSLAQRSPLPDYTKDGGDAANTPELTSQWAIGQNANASLSADSDVARVASLLPLGVSWIVLERKSVTAFSCPYENNAVRVCRLPTLK